MTNNEKKEQEAKTTEPAEKGFTAYLEIYGKSRMLAKVYDDFAGDSDELSEEEISSIEKYLENLSGVPEQCIHHCILSVVPDDDEEDDGNGD